MTIRSTKQDTTFKPTALFDWDAEPVRERPPHALDESRLRHSSGERRRKASRIEGLLVAIVVATVAVLSVAELAHVLRTGHADVREQAAEAGTLRR